MDRPRDNRGPGAPPNQPPSITLPKGGGAIRGIGEKFAANPVSGSGSVSVPIATSPGRSGFGPSLTLSYDSSAGNGPFGMGWRLQLPAITRKTEKGVPRYEDASESDVFVLSGFEDLVPELRMDDGPHRIRERSVTLDGRRYDVRRYRPRIEGLFARIERWTRDDGDVHWRSISRDNVLTLYGKDESTRIVDPQRKARVFSWLICESRDDKGNAVVYDYKPDDGKGVDLARAHERNRGDRTDGRRASNRYLKRIKYGNRTSFLDGLARRPAQLAREVLEDASWMFEVVFDYGEHAADVPTPKDRGEWDFRVDPFSSYRAGFEVRTTRLCRRVLMFHHFDGEPDVGNDCLVRSTDFEYSSLTQRQNPAGEARPVYTFIRAVVQSGYRRSGAGYVKRSLPPVEFEYTQPVVQDTVQDVDARSLENLPAGLDGTAYQWTDLHGEGIAGILTEQAGAWFYKRNLSPIARQGVELGPLERVAVRPNLALAGTGAQFMDLAGDGLPDLVVLDGPTPGFYEHDEAEGWQPFRPFTSRLNRDARDPNLRLVDLDGDGHTDVLISEDEAFAWNASMAEVGFAPTRRVPHALDEEQGPRLVFADASQSVYLADMSGDGLTDLVRVRNGGVCYWPNLGYGRFGAKVSMDAAPTFDNPDQFDPGRIRLADIDGTGTVDILYLHRDGVRIYFNQSGNGWSAPRPVNVFPAVDDVVSITSVDLLGNGTACLVWSSPLPDDTRRRMRYVNLIGPHKPHLLVGISNNLGAETRVTYAPSTKFYLQDKRDGRPWITRLPFPVHVVEVVETWDHVSRNRFVTRYAYHHGHFDGEEREFRGFGMVEQWDTETFATLAESDVFPPGDNVTAESHVPAVHTRTWFHTGSLNGADRSEYFREPGLTAEAARGLLLPDTVLPAGLSLDEEREACRAMKGAMLRHEVYALDGTGTTDYPNGYPYSVGEQSLSVRVLQPRGGNRHAVFFTHAREAIDHHYERNPADPRSKHALTLEVDAFGNVLREATIGYGRRQTLSFVNAQGQVEVVPNGALSALHPADRTKQTVALVTYTELQVTNAIDDDVAHPDDHRASLPCETRTYELTGVTPENGASRFSLGEWTRDDFALPTSPEPIPYERVADGVSKQKRLIEHIRILYRKDDLSSLLPLKQLEPLALPGEAYGLAFPPGLLGVFQRDGQALLPDPATVLGGQAGDQGGYLASQTLKADGRFPAGDPEDQWWIPSGQHFLSPDASHSAASERNHARIHFFLTNRYRDAFGHDTVVTYDGPANPQAPRYDLLITRVTDVLGNSLSATNDYRVLLPRRLTDPNGNRTEAAFDALGRVVGTAVMGKAAPAPVEGDSLEGFDPHLTSLDIERFYDGFDDPHQAAPGFLANATTRVIHDLDRFRSSRLAHPGDPARWLPVYAATLARETHLSAPLPPHGLRIRIEFSYSDGFGREIQRKVQAEPGPLREGGPDVSPRWVGSGWTVFNNKGQPVRRYEPFFSQLAEKRHRFELGAKVGVSPVLFYDPLGRVVATLYPNHSYAKVVFDPWRRAAYDVNDTVAPRNQQTGDPRTDPDIRGQVERYFAALPVDPANPWLTWYRQRIDAVDRPEERAAARKAEAHADTPTVVHFDVLGRPFLNLAGNRVVCTDHPQDGTEEQLATRVDLDIEGNQRAVRDADRRAFDADGAELEDPLGRVVMRYQHDMLGNRIHQFSMEGGARWMLKDAAGKPIRAWDSRGHELAWGYDDLRRLVEQRVRGSGPEADPRTLGADFRIVDKVEYGEGRDDAETSNLRTRAHRHLDSAGVVTFAAYDFKGNLLRSRRQLCASFRDLPDWAHPPQLSDETFTATARHDALNRPIQSVAPHSSRSPGRFNIIQPVFNQADLPDRVDVWLNRAAEPAGLLDPAAEAPSRVGIDNVDYDARGQRRRIDYKNGASTFRDYDPLTFRLAHLLTRRDAVAFPGDCPQPAPPEWPGCQVQNLRYVHDPVGNISHIHDHAQQTIYFKNRRVEPSNDFTHDALYRLIEATGREHLGQGGAPIPHSHDDAGRVGRLSGDAAGRFAPNDGNAMGSYVERYVLDAGGNIAETQHRGSAPGLGWTRSHVHAETSLTEDGSGDGLVKTSNRLSRTSLNADGDLFVPYQHDAHGNLVRMPHLGPGPAGRNLHWDHKDQLRQADLGGGGTAFYVHDPSGARVRRVWEKAPGVTEERIYLGGFEIFRRHAGAIGPDTATLERETLHIMDDERRIALVETRTLDALGDDPAPARLIRYQLDNHLGSGILELDHQAQIISYEEYTPYGSSSYQAVRNQTETAKRFRYAAKERDEETGLSHHGARYYAPWLGRWASCDPLGLVDGTHLYCYCRNSPVNLVDPEGTSGGASEGSVLVGTVDETLDRKDLAFNTETTVELTLADGSVIIRRFDRFFVDQNGDFYALEAKGDDPGNLTDAELRADRKVQVQGARFKIIQSAGSPPPGHGQKREDIAFTKGFVGNLKPGHTLYVDGSRNYQGTDAMPLTARAAVWKQAMDMTFQDAPGHAGMIRKTNPNAAPTWITPEQEAAEYEKNTGRKRVDPVERSKQWMTVKPNDHFLSVSRHPRSLHKEVILGTALAGLVVTSPVWAPVVARAATKAPQAVEKANRVRVVLEEGADLVVGQKVRVEAEEKVFEYVGEIGKDVAKKGMQMMLE